MTIRSAALVAIVFLGACGQVSVRDRDAGGDDDDDAAHDAAPLDVVSLEVTPASPAAVPLGLTVTLTATATYSDGSDADVTTTAVWSSGTEGVATVTRGVVSSIAVGSSVITASIDGVM